MKWELFIQWKASDGTMYSCNARAAATSGSICFPSGPAEAEPTEILPANKLAGNLTLYSSHIPVYAEQEVLYHQPIK